MNVGRASVWAEAVFHVLAHVDVPFASSCFSRAYADWIAERLGRPSEGLGADAAPVLATLTHESLARAQALAWVFASADSNRRWSDSTLDEVEADDDEALYIARSAGAFAEVLRATAELEMPDLEALAPPPFDREALVGALEAILPAAPTLSSFAIAVTPPLGLRGRVLGRKIFVGLPEIAEATVEHVAWQAAHEATVIEMRSKYDDFLALERAALSTLRTRARAAGLELSHAAWLARLDLRAVGSIPDMED